MKKYGFSPFIVVTGFSLLALFTFFLIIQNSIGLAFTIFPLAFIASGCLLAGLLAALFIAVKESFLELLLCLFVPFYIIYYLYSRIETTKHAYATTICGIIYYLGPFGLMYASYTINGYLPWGMVPRQNNPVIQARPKEIRNQQQPPALNPVPEFKFSKLEGINKFDLSQITPLLMSWPSGERPEFGSNFYIEKNANSIGQVFEVFNTRSYRGKAPAGGRMKFRVYLPPNLDPASPVPCVLVPPAGSNLLTGMEIDPPDLIPNPEHEPYLKAGFAVVTFSLDGPLLKRENASNHEFKLAHEAFRKSKAGMINCVQAFLETQAVIPGIDKDNVFIAGHSSAGTLSLLFAAHFPQVKGCLAYAPSVDLKKSMAEYLPEFKTLVPDVEDFIKLSSPQTHISSLTCPVFLFHSRGDQVTSFTNSQKFASQLKTQGTEVEFVASNGNDHYQTMIDEGIPQGIEWIKKHITKSNQSQPDPQMAVTSAVPSIAKNKKTNQILPKSSKSLIDVTRRKATFKVDRFDSIYEGGLKSNQEFWSKIILQRMQRNLLDLVPGLSKGTEKLDLNNMTLSFEFVGVLPSDIPQLLAGSRIPQPIKLAFQEPSIETVVNDPNARVMASNYLTFRIFSLHGFRFNKKDSANIAEAHLKQIDRYIPGSLIINFENKWIYIKLKGLGNKLKVEQAARNAFFSAGISVLQEKIELSPTELDKNNASNSTSRVPEKRTTIDSTTNPQTVTKRKYMIQYGVYSGKSIKESVKRSLKGFVWVDQKSIQFNPNTKEITFTNRSSVDQGALERALTRNKFYQLNITQEEIPEAKPTSKKEKAKVETE